LLIQSSPVFFEVICPMLLLDEAVLVAISTIRGTHNFFSRLRNLKDSNGHYVFNTVDFQLRCNRPECQDTPDSCQHILSELPAHITSTSSARVKLLMQGEDSLYAQEVQNIEEDPTEPMFGRAEIDWMYDEKNYYASLRTRQVSEVIISVDPDAGGRGSKCAIVSVAKVEGYRVVSHLPSARSMLH
jgi:hypothetical protein